MCEKSRSFSQKIVRYCITCI